MKYKLDMQPQAKEAAMVAGTNYRFTVLTSRLIRLEYSSTGHFEDRATRMAINRDFPVPAYQVTEKEDMLELLTEHLRLVYNKAEFEESGLRIELRGNFSAYNSTWYYGETGVNLKGTARTLDEADGAIELENGLLSANGYAVVDDSSSCILLDNGWVEPRTEGCIDLYFWGYGREYRQCLKDFFHLSGKTPLLPRYALGNWWSRFYPYTEDSYHELLERFEEEQVPFSVAVLDMDWHVTNIDPKYGSGWTGYTWNKEYFPKPERFLDYLHQKGMHVTLNVHPAEGARGCEEAYPKMAEALGKDAALEEKIDFDASDPEFLDAYFTYLHHPNEKMGVDFWWLDWQQKGGSKKKGYDPLFILNHYHYLDNGRDGKVPMTFSRYAGLGSHRYPVGFSGDTFATWASLDFQPYFTLTASNAGYGWWSHDIGGHMHGTKSDEMFVRWIQFGVFSPIMRIHSSDNPFFVKEPWAYDSHVCGILKRYLRLRHQLIPYLYTMNYRCHEEGEMLIEPLYYREPFENQAYYARNEYYFGTELLVCPITTPADRAAGLASFDAWLPEGDWYDVFTGARYHGGKSLTLYRSMENIPVLAKAGAIVPLASEECVENEVANPKDLTVLVFAGADGSFTMYEDNFDKETMEDGSSAETRFTYTDGETAGLVIETSDESCILPAERTYTVKLYGLGKAEQVTVSVNGESFAHTVDYEEKTGCIIVQLSKPAHGGRLELSVMTKRQEKGAYRLREAFEILDKAQIAYDLKKDAYDILKSNLLLPALIGRLHMLNLGDTLMGALLEILTREA